MMLVRTIAFLFMVASSVHVTAAEAFPFPKTPPRSPRSALRQVRAPMFTYESKHFPTLLSWQQNCKSLPYNVHQADILTRSGFLTLQSQDAEDEFLGVIDTWISMMTQGPLADKSLWAKSNDTMHEYPSDGFYQSLLQHFEPYVQKLLLRSGDQVYLHGDLHGDIHSLLKELDELKKKNVLDDQFRIIPDNVWIMFLGDYVDRGAYGCEVIYTLLRLALANPDRVVLVRGNHEDIVINKAVKTNTKNDVFRSTLGNEIAQKFDDAIDVLNHVSTLYNLLPVMCYVGVADHAGIINYIQCCHGGLELGYLPQSFLSDHSKRYQLLGILQPRVVIGEIIKKFYTHVKDDDVAYIMQSLMQPGPKTFKEIKKWWEGMQGSLSADIVPEHPECLGSMWHDFQVDLKKYSTIVNWSGRGLMYSDLATKDILGVQSNPSSYNIRGVIRAHQHGDSDMMHRLMANKGVFKLWKDDEAIVAPLSRIFDGGLVWTFNVAPDSMFGAKYKYTYDTYACITVNANYSDWKMVVYNVEVVPLATGTVASPVRPTKPTIDDL